MEKKSSVLTVRVPDSLYAGLVVISEDFHVSISSLVCSVLTAFVDGYAARNK